jgi:hypothetical protein
MDQEKNDLTKKNVSWQDIKTEDPDEEIGIISPRSPNPPKVIQNDKRCSMRKILALLVIIIILILFIIIFKILFSNSQTEDVSGSNKLLARIYRPANHYVHRCDDRGFDCCYIYTAEKNIQISPRYIVAKDEVGSNCPSLKKLVNGYNDYLNDYDNNVNCSEVSCCKIDNSKENKIRYNHDLHEILEVELEGKKQHGVSTCPKVDELISMYIHNYPSPYEDIIFLSVIGVILCCMGIASSSKKKSR